MDHKKTDHKKYVDNQTGFNLVRSPPPLGGGIIWKMEKIWN